MADLLGATLLLAGGLATLAAYLAVVALLLPGLTGRAQVALERMPFRAALVGLVNFLFFAVIATLLAVVGERLPPPLRGLFNFGALVTILALLALASVGLAALVGLLAGRIKPAAPPLKTSLWTAGLLLAAALAPLVGWLILAPLALLAGLGATIMALAQRPRPAATPPDAP